MAKEESKDGKTVETAKSSAETKQTTKEKQKPQESVYSANELAANAKKLFGVRQECAEAALKAAGKTGCTITEAKGIIEKFVKKEVK